MKSSKTPGLSRKELNSVRKLFRLFQDRNGTIDPHEVLASMQTLKLNEKNPVVYELFLGDSQGETLTFEAIKKVSQDVGEEMSDSQIRELLERAGQNGKELTYDEFCAVMTKSAKV